MSESNLSQLALAKLLKDKLAEINEAPAPEGSVQRVANDYAKSNNLKLEAPEAIKVNPNVSAKVAEAYAQMQHNPNDPKVQKAYAALIAETQKQYEDIQKSGFKVSKIENGMNPYKSSADLVQDITKNKHMSYFPSELGFGSSDVLNDHPMLKPTSIVGPDGKPMVANDLFRVVHDYFGHAKDGNKFGATGEERAYMAHKQMYSPEAQKALATETRGQNSYVNFGPDGEANRANPANTKYADQKAGLMPDWAGNHVDEIDNPLKYNAKKGLKIVGKSVLPLAALTGVAMADSPMDAVVPGGVESIGQSPDDELQMLTEIKALDNYKNSQASKNKMKETPTNFKKLMAMLK